MCHKNGFLKLWATKQITSHDLHNTKISRQLEARWDTEEHRMYKTKLKQHEKSNVYFLCLQKHEHLMQKQHPEPHISLNPPGILAESKYFLCSLVLNILCWGKWETTHSFPWSSLCLHYQRGWRIRLQCNEMSYGCLALGIKLDNSVLLTKINTLSR